MKDEQITEVADGVFAGIPYPYDGAMGAVVGAERSLVIDGTSYPLFARDFIADVEARTRAQPATSFVTHRHFDHFAGLAAFDGSIIASRLTRRVLETYDETWLKTNTERWIAGGLLRTEYLGTPTVRLPDLLFSGEVTVDLGGITVELIHIGGHCTDLAVAWVPTTGTLFASDAIGNGRDLYLDESDAIAWIVALEKLAELPVRVVVPGHGPIGDRSLLDAQIAALRSVDPQARRRSA